MTSLHISTSLKCERLAILGVLGKLGLVFLYFTGQICGFSSLDGNYKFLRFFLKRCAPPGFRFAHLVPPQRRRPGAATDSDTS